MVFEVSRRTGRMVPEEGVELFACYHIVADNPGGRMKAKVTMLARINNREFGFPYVPIEAKRNAVKFPIEWKRKDGERVIGLHEFEPDAVMGFYARFQN